MYCKVEYGNAYGPGNNKNGGGIFCEHSDIVLSNSILARNHAVGSGGGIYCFGSNTQISNNKIVHNYAGWQAGAIGFKWSEPTINNNQIVGNVAEWGGGIYCDHSSPIIIDNAIRNNSAIYSGGGIVSWASGSNISQNLIMENSAENRRGGGISFESDLSTLTNNIISENSSANGGGGIYCYYYTHLTTINNTVVSNSSESEGGGIFVSEYSCLVAFNDIIMNNEATFAGDIYIDYYTWTSCPCTVYTSFCNIDPSACFADTGSMLIYGEGNLNTEPVFADSLLHLAESSECIDRGSESIYVGLMYWDRFIYAPSEDFEGNTRPQGAGWDIGAYEYDPSIVEEIRIVPNKIDISVFPNPFNYACRIEIPLNSEIAIFDLNGRLVCSRAGGLVGGLECPESPVSRIPGFQVYIWHPDENLPSSVFLVRASLGAGDNLVTRKVVYLK